jgi:hypothetical protein
MASRSFAALLLMALASSACEMIAGINDRKLGAGGGPGSDANAGGKVGADGSVATGGGLGTGGGHATGGSPGSGGISATGGASGLGAAAGAGGLTTAGGATSRGGATSMGGATSTGGSPSAGGASSLGGITGSGGLTVMGGATGQGGTRTDAAVDAPLPTDAASDPAGCPAVGVLGTGNGLSGQYFVTPTLTGLALTRIDPSIDFNWPAAPDLGVPADGFSIRWTGQVQPSFSGRYTFYTDTDDGVRLWINGSLIIDDWKDHAVTENSGVADLVAGQMYDIKMEYYDGTGVAVAQLAWMSNCQAREIIPPSQLYAPPVLCAAPAIGTGTGLKGDYFDNDDLTTLRLTRTDATVSFSWPDGMSPDPSIAPLTYSVRWTGQVQAIYSGSTTFYVASDDGVRLFIDDALVIDDWTSHARTEKAATVSTVAGQKYNLRLEYFEASGGGQVQLLWGSACQAKDIIPQTQLYLTYMGMDCTDHGLGTGIGLRGDYYNNQDFTSLVATHAAEAVDFDWGAGTPDPSVGADTFSIRWTGKVLARYTGPTTFHTWSDDGARLWIDGQLIIDDWTDHQAVEDAGNANLTAGQLHDVRLDYHETLENATIRLLWSSPCQPEEVIPATQLYPPVSVGVDAGIDAGVDAGVDAGLSAETAAALDGGVDGS